MLVSMRLNQGRKLFPVFPSHGSIVVSLGFLLPASIYGQSETPLSGVVTEKDGKPLAGVKVHIKTFPGVRQGETITDKEGHFRLEHPGIVVHFYRDDLRSQTIIIHRGTSEVRVTMEPSDDNLVVPVCGKPVRGQRRIGFGKYGFQFNVPTRSAKIVGGKPAVDYVEFIIRPKGGNSYLALWFGFYAFNPDPENVQFINSVNFAQRNVLNSKGLRIGIDSWGGLQNGGSWRHTSMGGGGADYEGAPLKDGGLLDQIINSACWVAYPPQ